MYGIGASTLFFTVPERGELDQLVTPKGRFAAACSGSSNRPRKLMQNSGVAASASEAVVNGGSCDALVKRERDPLSPRQRFAARIAFNRQHVCGPVLRGSGVSAERKGRKEF